MTAFQLELRWVLSVAILVTSVLVGCAPSPSAVEPIPFNASRAYEDVEYQVALGPRTPGSEAHAKAVEWMVDELEDAGWDVEIQETTSMGHPIRNVIAKWGEGRPWIILGAHYDSRLVADQDPDPQKRSLPVPGANDGASGVAVLLELARVLPSHLQSAVPPADELTEAEQVWIVLFDAEDNGNLPGWDWILGSRAFVDSLTEEPEAAVIVDMIGDADLGVYLEHNSDASLSSEIWLKAHTLGYTDAFIMSYGYRIHDDHIPFLEAGIPAVDIIDFDYPYYHTTEDTPDKVSHNSLEIIGNTLIAWLKDLNL